MKILTSTLNNKYIPSIQLVRLGTPVEVEKVPVRLLWSLGVSTHSHWWSPSPHRILPPKLATRSQLLLEGQLSSTSLLMHGSQLVHAVGDDFV